MHTPFAFGSDRPRLGNGPAAFPDAHIARRQGQGAEIDLPQVFFGLQRLCCRRFDTVGGGVVWMNFQGYEVQQSCSMLS